MPSPPSSPTAQSLLAYLILHHGRRIPRDRLSGLFWPERPNVRARRALSNTLWQMRQALGPAADRLVAEPGTVAFAMQAGDWLDVEAFEERVHRYTRTDREQPSSRQALLELSTAVDLYRAPFLQAIYDDWALVERERLRELYLRALERLITLTKQRSDHESALAYARRLAAADPLRESAHRELMRLYYVLERPRAALEQFATLCEVMAEELGVSPTPATVALRQEIAATLDELAPPHLPIAPPPAPLLRELAHLPFVGRRDERTALIGALQAASQGRGGVALVEGEAGVGKSRLVSEVVAGARWRGFQAAFARVDSLVTPAPYQPLRDALSPLMTPLRTAQLAELVDPQWLAAAAPALPPITQHMAQLPPVPALAPDEEQQRLCQGLTRCVVGLASIAPLLLVLEDVQWADESTLKALPALVGGISGHHTLILLTYRTPEARGLTPVWEALEALDRALPLLRVRLLPFERSEVAALVQRALGVGQTDVQAGDFAQRLREEIGGNALFLVETLKSLLERGDLAPASDRLSDRWCFPSEDLPLPTPTSIQRLLGERLRRLPGEVRDVLEQVAILGEYADFPVLARTGDSESTTLLQALKQLVRRGFLVETAERYGFEHNLVRGVVYRAIPHQRRAMLHRRAARALEALHPGQVDSLAFHFHQGSIRDKALTYLLQASEHAVAVYDYERALTHYRKALTLVGDDAATRWDVLARQEEALGALSRREAQADVLDEMLRLAKTLDDPVRQAHTTYRLGWREVLAGGTTRALSLLDQAITLARDAGEHNLPGHCLISAARAWWRVGDVTRCQAAIEEAQDWFRETGNHRAETRAINMLGNLHLGLTGNYAQALAHFERNLQLARELGHGHTEAAARGNIGITCTLLGCYERSQHALAEAAQVMARAGDRHWQGIILHWQGANFRALGDLAPAKAAAAESLAICREVGNRNFEIAALELLGLIALDRHDPETASLCFQDAVGVARANHQVMDQAVNESHLALARLRLGLVNEARQLSERAVAEMERLGGRLSHMQTICFERYQIIAARDGPQVARPHLERAHRHLMDMAADIEDSDLRHSFLENVPGNRAIVTAHRLGHPPTARRQVTVRLARADAPTGRPLGEDEGVEVTWTVAAPEDDRISGEVTRRRHRSLRLLREAAEQSAAPTVQDLADALGVSARTIKRDLAALREQGHDARTRGTR